VIYKLSAHLVRVHVCCAFLLALVLAGPAFILPRPAAALPFAAPIDPLLQQQMQANPLQPLPVILEMEHVASPLAGANAQLAQQALALLQLNGQPQVALPLLASAAGLANALGITALSLVPGVAYIHFDAQVRAHDGEVSGSQLVTAYPGAVNADRVWAMGKTGKGVTVAVLDSGITLDPDLVQPTNRILASVNFADPLGSSTDPGGHGTHVSGSIAGNGRRSNGQYMGVAPEANLADVRVLDGNGNGRVSSVVLGIQWALDHRTQYNIRVLNLSLGTPAPGTYHLDPVAAAVEIAWLRGLVVVAASGNTGGAPDSPGADPYVITVGATDDQGTATVGDDVVGWFSSYGTPVGSTPKPDLVAPGRRIVSIRAPGSTLDRLLPDRVVTASNGSTYFRLTGTSMATGVVSGVVALLLQQQPGLTPDQVKTVLTGTARPFGQRSGVAPNPAAMGAGSVDAFAAVTGGSRAPGNRGHRPADPTARSLYPALNGQPLSWLNPNANGIQWTLLTWSNLAWDNLAWDNLAWDNLAWDNLAWDNLAWDNLAWDSTRWSNLAWDNIAWDSQRLD
jgi:serine protease AprX